MQANFYKSHYLSIQYLKERETFYTAATPCEPTSEFSYRAFSHLLHEIQVIVSFFLCLLNSTLELTTKSS